MEVLAHSAADIALRRQCRPLAGGRIDPYGVHLFICAAGADNGRLTRFEPFQVIAFMVFAVPNVLIKG